MTAREQPERYGWWKNELESLGLSIKKTNEFNDLEEISNLIEILKQRNYVVLIFNS
jgi:soluble P-type ATPase